MEAIKNDDLIDQMTGLYKQSVFFQKATQILHQYPCQSFSMMAIDIEHFKLFNDWYGYEEGNQLLRKISEQLKKQEQLQTSISGYMGGDDFVILLEQDAEQIAQLQRMMTGFTQHQDGDSGFLPAFGVYHILDTSIPVQTMYDCAMIALQSVKGNYAKRSCDYDPKMKQSMEEEQILLREIRVALQNDELTFYAQPVYNINNHKIVGLESLIRWQHPKKGLIAPGDFIPILERNGFITKVDLYLWEKVCQALSSWIKAGHQPVPISVNVSRMDIVALDLPHTFKELIEKYEIPAELVEIEITESAYMQDYDMISEVIDRLRADGFQVFMDDFGSGYSSLNMLKDVRVDTIKIDTKFLDMSEESAQHGTGILEAVINIANLMDMKIIAEGVETKEQASFLHDLGCDYVQGYYYHRPMPQKDLEQLLLKEEQLDLRGICTRRIKRLSIGELCNKNIVSETMLNNMLGGVAFYDVYEDKIELLKGNEQYFLEANRDPYDLEEDKIHVMDRVVAEDHERFQQAFRKACEKGNVGSRVEIRHHGEDGLLGWLSMRIFFLREQDGHQLFYASVQNVSDRKQQEEALSTSQQSLQAVLGLSGYNESFLKLADENRHIASSIISQMAPCGMVGGYCEDGFPIYFANEEMVRLLGYDTYQEMLEGIDGKIINTIYEADRAVVAKDIGDRYWVGMEYTTQYRTVRKDGSQFWTLDKGRVVEAEDGRMAIVSACVDISESMKAQMELQQLNQQLQEQNIELSYLTTDQPGGYHRCRDNEEFDFLYISNRFLEMFGYTREELQERFDNKFGRMIHPDDVERIGKQIAGSRIGDVYNLEYRMLSSNGYIWVADQTKKINYQQETFYYGVILDITATVQLKEQLEQLGRQDRALVENLLEDTTYSFKANLTKNQLCYDESTTRWLAENGILDYKDFQTVLHDVIEQFVVPEDKEKLNSFLDQKQLLSRQQQGIQSQACEYRRFYQGELCWMQIIYHLIHLDDTGDLYLYLYIVNINEQKKRELELKKRAEIDELTDLYNRQTAIPMIKQYLQEMQDVSAAIVMFDLDNFKQVNDAMGHLYGDHLLSDIAQRLKGLFRKKDIVCRMGGDEFLVLCKDIEESALRMKLLQILSELRQSYVIQNTNIICSISAGYTMIPCHGIDFQKLYSKADQALLEAKRMGRDTICAYHEADEITN